MPSATGASATAPDHAEQVRQGAAEHDRLFPDVAALRCESARPSPSAGGTGSGAPLDPEAAKHAENSMYKQMAAMTAAGRCRGEAHSARIAAALDARPGGAPSTEAELQRLLESLGYPAASAVVHRSDSLIGFDLFVPGTGPCVTGRLGSPVEVRAHGPYLEGGCTEPKGGH
ncbi:hypothetical protein [Kitasatospora sp. NPDC050463]|uniref:hypothetical protein n=1 Tax=Kitasatospora sp. NPDC050463 TaxID=3155786 RepID=UPI00340A3F63